MVFVCAVSFLFLCSLVMSEWVNYKMLSGDEVPIHWLPSLSHYVLVPVFWYYVRLYNLMVICSRMLIESGCYTFPYIVFHTVLIYMVIHILLLAVTFLCLSSTTRNWFSSWICLVLSPTVLLLPQESLSSQPSSPAESYYLSFTIFLVFFSFYECLQITAFICSSVCVQKEYLIETLTLVDLLVCVM